MSEHSDSSSNKKWFEENRDLEEIKDQDENEQSGKSHSEDEDDSKFSQYSKNSRVSTSKNSNANSYLQKDGPVNTLSDSETMKPNRNFSESQKSQNSRKLEESDQEFVSRLRERLRKIFVFYASFGSRCNSKYLKLLQFTKMMQDADLVDENLSKRKLDLIFMKVCQKSKLLKFDNFLELLFIISQKKFTREDLEPNTKFKKMLSEFMEPLFNAIYNQTDMGLEDQIFNTPITFSSLLIAKMISQPLKQIYRHYFLQEVQRPLNEKPTRGSVDTEIFKFLKDFEICPQMITKSVSHSLLTETLATEVKELTKNPEYKDLSKILGADQGDYFTFFRFVAYLNRIGVYIFSDYHNIPANQKDTEFTNDEKVYLLLERMDISQGLQNLHHVISKNANKGQTLTIARESLEQIHRETKAYPNFFRKVAQVQSLFPVDNSNTNGEDNSKLKSDFMFIKLAKGDPKHKSERRSSRSKSNNQAAERNSRKSKSPQSKSGDGNKENLTTIGNQYPSSQNLKYSKKGSTFAKSSAGISENSQEENLEGPDFILDECYDIFEKYLEDLHKIFECYCSFGEPNNFTHLSATKFMKLLKDTGITDEENEEDDYIPAQEAEIIFHEILQGMNPLLGNKKKSQNPILRAFQKNESNYSSNNSNINSTHQGKQKMVFEKFLQAMEVLALISKTEKPNTRKVLNLVENRLMSLADEGIRKTTIPRQYTVQQGRVLREKLRGTRQEGRSKSQNRAIQDKLNQNNHYTFKLVSILKEKTMVDLLGAVHKAILPIYISYSDSRKMINAVSFKKFFKDFGLFPDVISNAKMSLLFHEFEGLMKSKHQNSNVPIDNGVIDEHLFIEGLALVAAEMDYPKFELTNPQKMILLLERMNDSDGATKISREFGRTISQKLDIVSSIRTKFVELFKF